MPEEFLRRVERRIKGAGFFGRAAPFAEMEHAHGDRPPALGEQEVVAGVDAAAGLVEAGLDAVVGQADQTYSAGDASPPRSWVDQPA